MVEPTAPWVPRALSDQGGDGAHPGQEASPMGQGRAKLSSALQRGRGQAGH